MSSKGRKLKYLSRQYAWASSAISLLWNVPLNRYARDRGGKWADKSSCYSCAVRFEARSMTVPAEAKARAFWPSRRSHDLLSNLALWLPPRELVVCRRHCLEAVRANRKRRVTKAIWQGSRQPSEGGIPSLPFPRSSSLVSVFWNRTITN